LEILARREDVKVDSEDGLGRTPLSYAIEEGRGKVVHALIETFGADIHRRDKNGWPPFSYAAHTGSRIVLQRLSDLSAQPGDLDLDRRSMVHHCATSLECGAETFGWLLDKGASPLIADVNNMTPLHLAVQLKRTDFIQQYLSRGFSIDFAVQRRPYHRTVREENDIEQVKCVHSELSNPPVPSGGLTCLQFAASIGDRAMVAYLLAQVGDPTHAARMP
jgi:ankyrin repeat protein